MSPGFVPSSQHATVEGTSAGEMAFLGVSCSMDLLDCSATVNKSYLNTFKLKEESEVCVTPEML
jgi:hypothetical protein